VENNMSDSTAADAVPTARATKSRPAVGTAGRPVAVKHWGRGTFAAIVVLAVLFVGYSLAVNPNFDWPVVGQYVFSTQILGGLLTTLELTVVSMVVSVILAVVIAVMRISPSRVLSGVAFAYIFVFRGIPLIVLLVLVGNLGLFLKTFTLGIPFTNVVFYSAPMGQVVTPFIAGVLGLSLAGSAYMAEIVRAGLLSIGRGQHEAAKALGLDRGKTLRYIIIPQALRVIVPPMGNEFIGMLKSTAIVSVIAGGDLLTVAEGISGTNYRTIELLIVASIWYLLVIVVFSAGQLFLERKTAER
jgi:polar amino acid transport system permease protein